MTDSPVNVIDIRTLQRQVVNIIKSLCHSIMACKKPDARRRLDQIVNQIHESPVSFDRVDDAAAKSNLNGKSILVTGGASGLGECFTRRFADLGAFVVIADLDTRQGAHLEKELLAKGQR